MEIFAYLSLNFHNSAFKLFIFHYRAVLNPGFIGIDGMDRVIEKFGDSFTVCDAQTYQSEDTHLGGKGMVVGWQFTVFLLKQKIEFLYKVRENFEERLVESLIHILSLGIQG